MFNTKVFVGLMCVLALAYSAVASDELNPAAIEEQLREQQTSLAEADGDAATQAAAADGAAAAGAAAASSGAGASGDVDDAGDSNRPEFRCELCIMVVGRKLKRHKLCDGMMVDGDKQTCRTVVETLTTYDRYVVDWMYGDGCQRQQAGAWADIKPCPSHVICSWMIFNDNGNKRTFCQFEDHRYRRSPDFHKRHKIPTTGAGAGEAQPEPAGEAAADEGSAM